jgi:MtN3 and saliva related transmembrane protein
MDIASIIGSAAGILTTAAFLPQLTKTWRTKSARDVSAIMLAVLATGVFLWFIYGIYIDSWPVIIANLVTFSLACIILALKLKYR